MRRIHLYTIAAGNYLPKVRVLFESVRRKHPEWVLHLFVADRPRTLSALETVGADEVHHLPDLGIADWKRWAFRHALIEVATAMKPFALRRLLMRPDCAAAIYLDPDIVLFSALDDVAAAFDEADILLTPHLTSPETTLGGIIANELCTAQHGIYNLGFIGVAARAEGRRFADWWADRLYYFCREEIPSGIYTDQRWIDFVPAFFERTRILRSPRFNVAPWNLPGRRLAGSPAEGLTVNGEPLGFYHFSQVDSAANDEATAAQPAAVALVEWYRQASAPLPNERLPAPAWTLGVYDNNTPILIEQRRVYGLRDDLQRTFADPYTTGAGTYLEWWARHAKRAYPALFSPATRAEELRKLATATTYQRTGDTGPVAAADVDRRRRPWLDEDDA